MADLWALTVKQPWASAIAYGPKRVENRGWPTTHRGLLAIHAGKSVDWDASERAWAGAGLLAYFPGGPRKAWTGSLSLGAVVAVAELTGCHYYNTCEDCQAEPDRNELRGCSPWAQEWQWHWVLANVRPLDEPIPCRGAQRLWRLPPEVEAAAREQLEAVHG